MSFPAPEFSFVVPLHNTGEGLRALLGAFRAEAMTLDEPWELVLVDDGSVDGTFAEARRLTTDFPAPVTLVELARNYGEHAAVLEGWRRSQGRFVVNLDDDLQNPVSEAVRLLRHLRSSGAEIAYSCYEAKQHAWWRNAGSRLSNSCATLLLGKPRHLYLSSFRAVRRELIDRVARYSGPFPHLDGLILGATNRITQLAVRHEPRRDGRSGYTLRKLLRLAMGLLFDFSVMPLRLAGVLGAALCGCGVLLLGWVLLEMLGAGVRQPGWASLMGVLAVFSGAQLLMLGIIGEYVGRAFMTVSGRPQSFVREIVRLPEGGAS
ncbi:MAG: glycosyltransferase [Verrucomicrobiaceae bacterium]|jgi:glycosyltransferase involved in cell wall biosynthesis|nr:glycosyltransferase [Verrucomicrobiaceae bacterium]